MTDILEKLREKQRDCSDDISYIHKELHYHITNRLFENLWAILGKKLDLRNQILIKIVKAK